MLLIEKGFMIDPKSGKEGKYDILTSGREIIKITKDLRCTLPEEVLRECHIINAEGLLVFPGLVDVHVHFREPGATEKEDIHTGSKAAAKGGFTTVVMMANTIPPIDNREVLDLVLDKTRGASIHVKTCANVTLGMEGKELTPMEELAEQGAIGFSDDGRPILNKVLVREAMKRAAALSVPISFHEENPEWIEDNGINQGKASSHFEIGGSSREAEIAMIERDLQLAQETGACVNIQHISTKEGVSLVRKARMRGCNIHAEATPHHFALTEEAAIRYGTLAKMNPPLREEEDRQAIIQGLVDGTIDLIATDHAPHTSEEKSRSIKEAPSGIIGLETALSVGIAELVNKGHLTMMELLKKMSTNPAAMYGLDAGYLAVGGPADIVLLDAAKMWKAGNYISKSENTPFTGWSMPGVVCSTICGGEVVYKI